MPMRYGYTLRLLDGDSKFFGPGVAHLLKLIEKEGSIRKAAQTMEMAYSKAWKMLTHAHEVLGFALVETKAGGVEGGGTLITNQGRAFLKKYEEFERGLREQADLLFEEYFGAEDSGERGTSRGKG